MKANTFKKPLKIRWSLRILLLITVLSVCLSNNLPAKTAREIDVSVDVAIERFYKQVIGAEKLVKVSKGILVMPHVFKGAFFIGGEYGEGALRIDGKTVDYYNTVSGSLGIQIGGESKDIILLFMTVEALEQFRASKGWEAGVDGNIAFFSAGAGQREDTTTSKEPIVGFVFDAKGLIADLSVKGAKFTKLKKTE
jgi:lipid-binding SYLF domain-containing protein